MLWWFFVRVARLTVYLYRSLTFPSRVSSCSLSFSDSLPLRWKYEMHDTLMSSLVNRVKALFTHDRLINEYSPADQDEDPTTSGGRSLSTDYTELMGSTVPCPSCKGTGRIPRGLSFLFYLYWRVFVSPFPLSLFCELTFRDNTIRMIISLQRWRRHWLLSFLSTPPLLPLSEENLALRSLCRCCCHSHCSRLVTSDFFSWTSIRILDHFQVSSIWFSLGLWSFTQRGLLFTRFT